MTRFTRLLIALAVPVALLLGSCTEKAPDASATAAPKAITSEQDLLALLKGADAAPLAGSECKGSMKTTSGLRFEFNSSYTCAACRKNALSHYSGRFAKALLAGGWNRGMEVLPQRLEFAKGKERLIVEIGSDAKAAVDGSLTTYITHGIK